MADNIRLSPKKLKAIEVLLAGGSKRAAAAAAGISEQQLYRWAKQPEFAAAISAQKTELMERVNARLLALALQATAALGQVLETPDTQTLALRASDIVLARLMSIRELSEFERRLTALEETKNDQTND